MQTIEAMLSLLFFLSLSPMLLPPEDPANLDDSLYRLQLAGDAWRVLHLRGCLRDLDDQSRGTLEAELGALGGLSGLCFFMEGIDTTNCRSGETRSITSSLRKTAIYDGRLRTIAFSVGK